MKRISALFFILLASSVSLSLNSKDTKRYVIGWQDKTAGFFHCFFDVLNKLGWCDKNRITPVVYWDNDSVYYNKDGYNGCTNVWEYYFYPVSKDTYQIGDVINKNSDQTIVPEGISHIGWVPEHTREKWYRRVVSRIIEKYIHIKPAVKNKIESFYKQNMLGKKTIGIHIRGTDKYREAIAVSPSTIFEQANILAAQFPACQFLIATDELSILEEAKSKLSGKVIYYEAFRSQDGRPIHFNTHQYNKAKLGEEVLIETILLARTDIFLHTLSNVSSAVLYFNAELDNVVFRHEAGKESEKKGYDPLDADMFWWATV